MADGSHIEWTDATWNPVTGCSVTSPGCTNCYAMKLAGTRLQHHPSRAGLTQNTKAGPVWTGEVRLNEQWLDQPLKWTRPRRIFVCAHGDLFAEGVPDEWIDRVFAVMALAPQHTFQVLTKRAARLREYMADIPIASAPGRIGRLLHPFSAAHGGDAFKLWQAQDRLINWPLPNVWLGASVEDQPRADERLFALSCTPAAIRFASFEPLLGPVDPTRCREHKGLAWNALTCDLWSTVTREIVAGPPKGHGPIDLAIIGGESGPGARPMELRWVHDLVSVCQAAGTKVFVKQLGSRPVIGGQTYTYYAGGPRDIRPKSRKGGDWSEWPAGLRVRELPT